MTTNAKLAKESGHTIYGLNLAPHKVSGYNVCPHAGECAKVCIGEHSGFMVMPNVRAAQIRKTKMFFEDRLNFLSLLHSDMSALEKRPSPACRLNVDSDLPWEKLDPSLFNYNIIMYDYTKWFSRAKQYVEGNMPSNYYLTYSWSERSDKRKTNWLLNNGGNVNMVFSLRYKSGALLPLPNEVKIGTKWWPVVDADLHDLRIPSKDGIGVVTGVRAKTKASLIPEFVKSGFFVSGNKVK